MLRNWDILANITLARMGASMQLFSRDGVGAITEVVLLSTGVNG
jgi:hypothetical protein